MTNGRRERLEAVLHNFATDDSVVGASTDSEPVTIQTPHFTMDGVEKGDIRVAIKTLLDIADGAHESWQMAAAICREALHG